MQFREQGKRIKVQAHYECRRHDTSSINKKSPARATLLHSPGCNEGKARYETLGRHERKVISSSVGAALTVRVLALRCGCAAPTGLNKCGERLTQGASPGLWRSIAPLGLFDNNSKKWLRHIQQSKYEVNTFVSTRTYWSVYVYLFQWVRVLKFVST